MFLVSVSGATSRAGKTALAASLLRARPGAVAVKFTTTEDVFERCPRGTPCVVCDIATPFRIVEDPLVLAEDGTDTRRLADAGAAKVVWAIARAAHVDEAWTAVRERTKGAAVVVMEGSTIVETSNPDLLFFVVHPHLDPARWKPTASGLIARADAVVLNRVAGDGRPPSSAVRAAIAARNPRRVAMADAASPSLEWAEDLAARIPFPINAPKEALAKA
jgi:hypothetical protein